MDKIRIVGLKVFAHVGVPAAERLKRQRVLVDLELELDLRKAGREDRVSATVDYAAVASSVKRHIERKSFRLVEAMAEESAKLVLDRFHPRAVWVRIRKFSVPSAESVGVELNRRLGRSRKR